ncbi:hypothetical protein Acsp01_82830 [Actinoplanes sp. NBRC 101535]|nr:hypothetical protein Acsp01_82830 [Actinoplanes sp. NBRC 101535]
MNDEAGFAILLGRPLGDFDRDATYALYYSCSDLSGELFARSFDAGVLTRGEIVHPPYPSISVLGELFRSWDPIAPHWSLDLGLSWFRSGDPEEALALDLPELAVGLSGVELGRLLVDRDWKPRKLRRAYPEIDFRVHTDGTLLDAMRAATGTMLAHGEIFEPGPVRGVEPQWQRKLAVLPAELRDHLSVFCRDENTARSDGAFYLGTEDPGLLREAEVIAAFQFGEAQSWSAIVQIEADLEDEPEDVDRMMLLSPEQFAFLSAVREEQGEDLTPDRVHALLAELAEQGATPAPAPGSPRPGDRSSSAP